MEGDSFMHGLGNETTNSDGDDSDSSRSNSYTNLTESDRQVQQPP